MGAEVSIESTIASALGQIGTVQDVERMLEGKSGYFFPSKYPDPDGPTGARCSFEFFNRLSNTRVLNFTIRSDRFSGSIDMESLASWADRKSRNSLFGVLRVHAVRAGDEWEFCYTVRHTLSLRGLTQEFTIEVVMDMLEMWQEAVEEANNRIAHAERRRVSQQKESVINGSTSIAVAERPVLKRQSRRAAESTTVIDELSSFVGLRHVKELINRLIAQQKIGSLRQSSGLVAVLPSPHLVFAGNPGTGKTTVARLIGRLYKDLGLLSKGHVVEVDRSNLVAAYVGQTALRTKEACEKALGGVLFIDEAYSLIGGGQDYGKEAIETLLTFMEANRGNIVVVAAGYPDRMQKFLDSNPGLRSRFDLTLQFDDYSVGEMMQIFQNLLNQNEYDITDAARTEVRHIVHEMARGESFANARQIRTLFNDMVGEHAASLAGIANATPQQLRLFTTMAIPARIRPSATIDINDMPPID
jgi:ATP-dependent Clp protease ATP-binding subunit ClpA